jgi:hypothetical protein
MPPLTTAAFTQALADAPAIPDALRLLRAQLEEAGKGLQLAYFAYDARREVVAHRYRQDTSFASEPFQVSLDHLPTKLRRELTVGGALADFGEQSADFLRFFGMDEPSDGYLLVQGIRVHGELCGIVAVREPRQRFGSRVVDRISAPVGVFALAVGVLAERAARREAEESLERIMSQVHEEHSQALWGLQLELTELRRQLTATGMDARVAELQRAAQNASERAKGAAARLIAVEQQVATAVAQLEKAHLDLSRQAETLRAQGAVLHRIEGLLRETSGARDPRVVLEEVLAAVTATR